MKKFFLRVSHWEQGLAQAAQDLRDGKHRHDVLEAGIRALELDPADDSVGYGGYPNIIGNMELDAAFMDGNDRRFGAVAGVSDFLPVRIARRLMEYAEFHALLIGAGAELFARECRLEPENTYYAPQREKWRRDVMPLLEKSNRKPLAEIVKELAVKKKKENRDTTIMIASDGSGLSGAASTSGWSYKYPGRVGDTPLCGAGMYVDSRFGGCACTFTGEMSMRAGTARYVVAQMEAGKNPQQAVAVAIKDIESLKSGVQRGLVIHALSREGEPYVAALNAEEPIEYQYWNDAMPRPECRKAEVIKILSLKA